MEEIWKDIEGYEGLYEVSNLGRVRSLGRTIMRRTRWGSVKPYTIKPRELKHKICQGGYHQVGLFDIDGVSKPFKVHRLVAQYFVPNPEGLPEVNHKDEDKDNNRSDNLEWVTHIENCNHGTRNERSKGKRSKPVQQLDADNNIVAEYPSIIEASRATGIQRTQIRGCVHQRKDFKTAGGYRWKFKEQ
jgi:hypothetical protein